MILIYCIVAISLFLICVGAELIEINTQIKNGKRVSSYDYKYDLAIIFFACTFWPATVLCILLIGALALITKAFDWLSFRIIDIMIESIKIYQEKKRIQVVLKKSKDKSEDKE